MITHIPSVSQLKRKKIILMVEEFRASQLFLDVIRLSVLVI